MIHLDKIKFLEILGNRIELLRKEKGLSLRQLAQLCDIDYSDISKIEKGKTILSYVKLVEIARILEVSVEDIISFDSERYFSSINTVKGNSNNGSILINSDNSAALKELYEDKIRLLEKLLSKTEEELNRYKRKFGQL